MGLLLPLGLFLRASPAVLARFARCAEVDLELELLIVKLIGGLLWVPMLIEENAMGTKNCAVLRGGGVGGAVALLVLCCAVNCPYRFTKWGRVLSRITAYQGEQLRSATSRV